MNPLIIVGVCVLVAAGLTLVILHLALRYAAALPLDVANGRSLHVGAIPRIGGIGMAIAVTASQGCYAYFATAHLPAVLYVAAVGLVGVSFVDDCRTLPVVLRLLAHMVAAVTIVALLDVPWFYALALVLALIWMTNLYNFMDGSDGLAGTMAAIGFAAYALAAWPGNEPLACLAATVAAAAAAFLVFNGSPATVFLGDAGSIPLGFLAGALGILGWQQGLWSIWFPLQVFLPFIADATVTLGRRLLQGEAVWQAHRDHYYQRLVRLGLSHRTLAVYAGALMACCAATAIAALAARPEAQGGWLFFWCLVGTAIMIWTESRWRRAGSGREN
jgi:UDP-N-acetylmuramyl pentapeptide phosphotransferase/UDP-N-acetylglucosamine-1-phosphate transferase